MDFSSFRIPLPQTEILARARLWAARLVSVRRRYVFTRNDRLRLRYVVAPALAAILLAGGLTARVLTGAP